MASKSARDAVLGAVQRHLRSAREAESAPPPLPDRRGVVGRPALPDDIPGRVARFKEIMERVGGHVTVARDAIAAAAALNHVITTRRIRRCARSQDPDIQRLSATLSNITWIDPDDRAALLECDAGLTGAQAGIAETGTLVLRSREERHRLVSLVPPVHVAVLRASRILGGLEEAFEFAAADGPAALSRAVTLITGPSRTADIELTLVVGVHGPKELHVIVLEENDA